MENSNNILLYIDEDNLNIKEKSEIKAILKGEEVLGIKDEIKKIIYNTIPKAVTNGIESIVPENYELNEIQIKFQLAGEYFGLKIGGDVSIKISPKK